MAIVEKRVFFAKVGKADELVETLPEGDTILNRHGLSMKTRIMPDYHSGRSDRVQAEWTFEQVSDMDSEFQVVAQNPAAAADMGPWMGRLNDLIHYSEAELWQER
jgi:hypothetical protein